MHLSNQQSGLTRLRKEGIMWVGRGVRLQKGVRFTTDGNPMPILLPPVLVHFCQLPTLWQQCIWSVSMPFVKLKPAVGWLVDCQFYCLLSRLCGNPPTMHMAASDLCQCRPSFLFVKQITAADSVTLSNWQWRQTKSQMFALPMKQCIWHIFYLCLVQFSFDHTWLIVNKYGCLSNPEVFIKLRGGPKLAPVAFEQRSSSEWWKPQFSHQIFFDFFRLFTAVFFVVSPGLVS